RCLEVKRHECIEPPGTGPNARITKPTKLTNVYAILRGTDPAQANRVVLVTGHYDSRNSDNFNTHDPAPGANDDASGTAVSIESSRVLSKLKFPSTIIFLTVAGEEQGLDGSRHFAKLAKSEGWDLEAVLNNDIVGGDTTPGAVGADKSAVRVFSEGVPGPATLDQLHEIQTIGAENDSPARELARAIVEIDLTYFHPTSQRLSAGTPPGQPHKVTVLNPPYDTRTVLRWDKPAGFPAGASFEVVYRDTDQPNWTSVIPAGDVTTIAIPISKDNVIFGVRSVDAAGHRSAA